MDAVDQSGRSALMMAAERGSIGAVGMEHVPLLISRTLTLLSRADFYNCACVCTENLIMVNADLTLTDQKGNTVLHLACSSVSVCFLFREYCKEYIQDHFVQMQYNQ